jgi:hypothetical protein
VRLIAAVFVIGILLAAGPVNAGPWTFEDLWPGTWFDLAIEPDGTPHVVYTNCTHTEYCFDATGPRRLIHAIKSLGVWSADTLASDPAGFTPAVTLDDTGGVHIVYTDSLYHMQYIYGTAGGPWVVESLPHSGPMYYRSEPDIAVDNTGGVHVSYNERERPWYQYRSGSGWIEQQVSFNYADNDLARSSMKTGTDGIVRIAFWSFATYGVVYENTGGVWTENVIGGGWGQFPSLALDANNNSHILYTSYGGAYYATNKTGAWAETTLDMNGGYGDILLTAGDAPVVAYPATVAVFDSVISYDVDLYVSVRGDSTWQRQSIVSYRTPAVGGAGFLFRPRLDIDYVGTLHIAYTHPVTGILTYGQRDLPVAADRSRSRSPNKPELKAVPNPFNPSTTIHYMVPETGRVTIDIFDVRGRHVRTLVDRHHTTGHHEVRWDSMGNNGAVLGSGVYFCRMTTHGLVQTRKITLVQ